MSKKTNLLKKEKELEEEIEHLEDTEYGLKELIHGIILGTLFGFVLAWVLLR